MCTQTDEKYTMNVHFLDGFFAPCSCSSSSLSLFLLFRGFLVLTCCCCTTSCICRKLPLQQFFLIFLLFPQNHGWRCEEALASIGSKPWCDEPGTHPLILTHILSIHLFLSALANLLNLPIAYTRSLSYNFDPFRICNCLLISCEVNFHCTGSRAKEPPWCDELAVVYVQHVDDGPNLYFLHVCIGYGRRGVLGLYWDFVSRCSVWVKQVWDAS